MNLTIPDIRLARTADAAAIACLSRDCIEAGLSWSWTTGRVLRAITDSCSNVAILATCGTDAALPGFGIMHYGEEVAHLALLAVQPEHRGRGLGRRLLEWLEKPALVAGIRRVRLEARADNPGAIAFYQRCGYRTLTTLPGYYQGRLDALRLEKPLWGVS
jgi:[ribosomal protein S18]-alanine N-acetyltransferase